MLVLDTDTLTHLLLGHKRVTEKRAQATEEVALSMVTRIEILLGRFASVLKAENGEKLLLVQQRLVENERDLVRFIILPIDAAAAAEFDRLRQMKKLKIRRGDLLIAAITFANHGEPCRVSGRLRTILNRPLTGLGSPFFLN